MPSGVYEVTASGAVASAGGTVVTHNMTNDRFTCGPQFEPEPNNPLSEALHDIRYMQMAFYENGLSLSCTCRDGFFTERYAPDTPEEVWICTPLPYCDSDPCQNGDCLVDTSGIAQWSGYKCECEDGFAGRNCDVALDMCASFPCLHGGACAFDGDSSFACSCPSGWAGETCHQNILECKSQPCQNGGGCADELDGYTCYCESGYAGTSCEHDINECFSSPCHHGSCLDGVVSFECQCNAGWSGAGCDVDIDNCVGATCFHGGLCVDHLGGFTCSCAAGYRGDDCSLNVDECLSAPCQNNGTCIDGQGSYNCTCEFGFEGAACEVPFDRCSPSENDCVGGCVDECIATGPASHVCSNLTDQTRSICVLGGISLDNTIGRRRLQLSQSELNDATGRIVERMIQKLEDALCPFCGFAMSIAEMVGYDTSVIDNYRQQIVSTIQGEVSGEVQAGYDSLSNAFTSFTNDNLQHFAEPSTDGSLDAASAKSFSFSGSLHGVSVDITFYLFLLPDVLQSLLDALILGAGNGYVDWNSISVEFAVKFTLQADNFQVTTLPCFSSMPESWLSALNINGAIDLVLSSADITLGGQVIIEQGFSFAGIVSDSPTAADKAPFLATLESAAEGNRTTASVKYLKGYLPLDIGLGGASWDTSLGGAWAQVGLTNCEFRPSFMEGIDAEVMNAYVKVEGLGSDDYCGDTDTKRKVTAPVVLLTETACTAAGHTWYDQTPQGISFFADFDLNLGDDEDGNRRGRLVGKVSGSYQDMSMVLSGQMTTVDLPALGRVTVEDVSVTLGIRRSCEDYQICETNQACSMVWEEITEDDETSQRLATTPDARERQCVEWVTPPPAPPGAVHCSGVWGAWTECSASCGGGQRTRTFSVITEASGDGAEACIAGDNEIETEECNADECGLVHCEGEWSRWTECSTSCAPGTQTQDYEISVEAATGGNPCPAADGANRTRSCNVNRPCPVDCVGSWVYPACSVSCADWVLNGTEWELAHGMHAPVFTVTTHAQYGGESCAFPHGTTGFSVVCADTPCHPQPTDCVGEWSAYGSCSADCGGGTLTRTYQHLQPATEGGRACTIPLGFVDTPRECNQQPCPVDCAYAWGPWRHPWWGRATCSRECGGGRQKRGLRRVTQASHGGVCGRAQIRAVPGNSRGEYRQYQSCNTQACPAPVSCTGSWGSWGTCSATCPARVLWTQLIYGDRRKHFSVTTERQHGGARCPSKDGAIQAVACYAMCYKPYVPTPPARRRRRSWRSWGWRRMEDNTPALPDSFQPENRDQDPYGIQLHGGIPVLWEDETAAHDGRRRLQVDSVTEDPGEGGVCIAYSEIPAESTPAQVQVRKRQVEFCQSVETCRTECKFVMGGDLDIIGDATLASASNPDETVALPFFGKVSGTLDIPMPKLPLPSIPGMGSVVADMTDPESNQCQFLNRPCRDIARLAFAFGSEMADLVAQHGAETAVEMKKDEVKAALVAMAKDKAKEMAEEQKKKAMKKAQDALMNRVAAGSSGDNGGAGSVSEQLNSISIGVITMGKMDYIANLGDTICGMSGRTEDEDGDGVVDCVANLPEVPLSDVEAELRVANKEMTVAGYKLQAGVEFKLSGNMADEPTQITDVREALGFPAGMCTTPGGVESPVSSRVECMTGNTGRRRMQDDPANTYAPVSVAQFSASMPFPRAPRRPHTGPGPDTRAPPPPPTIPQFTWGFEKLAPPVETVYQGCRERVAADWTNNTYNLGASDAPAVECADKCKIFTHMALSWADTCSCGWGMGTGAAVDDTLCDSDGDGDSDQCATGDVSACRQQAAVYSLTGPGVGNSGGMTLVRTDIFMRRPNGALEVGISGNFKVTTSTQDLYWQASAYISFTGLTLPTFIIGGHLITPWKNVAGITGLHINTAALYVGIKPFQPGFAYFRAALAVEIGSETRFDGEVIFDLRSFPPKALMRASADQFTMLAVVEFAEMRLNTQLIPDGPIGDLMKDELRGYGYERFRFLAVTGDLEVPKVDGTTGVDVYRGPQLEISMQDQLWGGTRTMNVSFKADRQLVPYFPYFDLSYQRHVVGGSFFNSLANFLKFGAEIGRWLKTVIDVGHGTIDDVTGAFDSASDDVRNAIVIHEMRETGFLKAHCEDSAGVNEDWDETHDEDWCRSRSKLWVPEKEVGIQLVGFFQDKIKVMIKGHMTIFGSTFKWNALFDRTEFFDAAGAFVRKVGGIIMKWFRESVEPFAVKFFKEHLCPISGLLRRLEWCDYNAPVTSTEPYTESRSYTFKGPYREMAFTRVIASGQIQDVRNLVYQVVSWKTVQECRSLCDRGLDRDSSGNLNRHGQWTKAPLTTFTKCYGFASDAGAAITAPPSIQTVTAGTCNVGDCASRRGMTFCNSNDRCECQPGYYTIDGEVCQALPDMVATNGHSASAPSDWGKTNRDTGGTCTIGNCVSSRGATSCVDNDCVSISYPCGCSWRGCSLCYQSTCSKKCVCAGTGHYSTNGACIEKPSTQYNREKTSMQLPALPAEPSLLSPATGTCTLYAEATDVPRYGTPIDNLWVVTAP